MSTKEDTDIQKALEKYWIEYSAEFVPFSQSRNKDEKLPSLNWLVTLSRSGLSITTDYGQGCAHVVGYKQLWNPNAWDQKIQKDIINKTCETGKVHSYWKHCDDVRPSLKAKIQPQPGIEDVLSSLLLDSDVLNYATFEEWAGDFGYEEDSRSAERIYQACLKIALQINQMFTEAEREELRELFHDY